MCVCDGSCVWVCVWLCWNEKKWECKCICLSELESECLWRRLCVRFTEKERKREGERETRWYRMRERVGVGVHLVFSSGFPKGLAFPFSWMNRMTSFFSIQVFPLFFLSRLHGDALSFYFPLLSSIPRNVVIVYFRLLSHFDENWVGFIETERAERGREGSWDGEKDEREDMSRCCILRPLLLSVQVLYEIGDRKTFSVEIDDPTWSVTETVECFTVTVTAWELTQPRHNILV